MRAEQKGGIRAKMGGDQRTQKEIMLPRKPGFDIEEVAFTVGLIVAVGATVAIETVIKAINKVMGLPIKKHEDALEHEARRPWPPPG